jgi:hypothetical protein
MPIFGSPRNARPGALAEPGSRKSCDPLENDLSALKVWAVLSTVTLALSHESGWEVTSDRVWRDPGRAALAWDFVVVSEVVLLDSRFS